MKYLLWTALLLTSTQVQALSCMRPEPVRAFLRASEAVETYIVVMGRLDFDETLLPGALTDGMPVALPIPAQFSGRMLTPDGFTTPLEGAMVLQPTCAGPWCGAAVSGQEVVTFARLDGDTYVIEADPCGSMMFLPDPQTIALLTSCIRGDACVPSDLPD